MKLISKEYKKQLKNLQSKKAFSQKNFWYKDLSQFLIENNPESVLDFGCARGILVNQIKKDFPNIKCVDGYDPGVEEYETMPEIKYDILISTDVFEHIEPAFLDETLKIIDNLYLNYAWIIIACYPAKKYLPDGRNAHLTVESPDWWREKIKLNMKNSEIIFENSIIGNPDKPVIDKRSKDILIPVGKAIEYRLILKK